MSKEGTENKRKRDGTHAEAGARKRRAARKSGVEASDIEQLEKRIEEDPEKVFGEVENQIRILGHDDTDTKIKLRLCVALCKIFSRLFALGYLTNARSAWKKDHELHSRYLGHYETYRQALVKLLKSTAPSQRLPFLHLCWKVLEQDAELSDNAIWHSESIFRPLLAEVVEVSEGSDVRETYVVEYMNNCHDCLYYSLGYLLSFIATGKDEKLFENIIEILLMLGEPPASADELNFLATPPIKGSKKPLITPISLKRRVEEVWLSVLRSPLLSSTLRKNVLPHTSTRILPWMSRPETLMDFLTDSYNVGGSTSFLALSGLFELIASKNLDYPSFYPKLYSLLDASVLQSKHRSRFLRHLNTFLSSPRLPANLIASFIKRLARHAIFAPPAAIVAVVPYVYNLLRAHPTCTFMLHRHPHPPYTNSTEDLGEDPFDMSEPDPQKTSAIDSSLWELETLQSHYHPNVASIARIISEQFTKQQYNIEDFLDHGYGSMLDSELGKEGKKEPVVEWRIPKRIFTTAEEGEEGEVGAKGKSLLQELWDFS